MPENQKIDPHILQFEGELFRFILSLTGNLHETEELLHHTLYSLSEEGGPRTQDVTTMSWAIKVATNLVREALHQKKRQGKTPNIDDVAIEKIAAQQKQLLATSEKRCDALRECLAELPFEQRELVQDFYAEDSLKRDNSENSDILARKVQRSRRLLFACTNSKLAAGG
ncbi:MAG: hypothetical protein AAF483_01260 [Planctomycetota bacterium]